MKTLAKLIPASVSVVQGLPPVRPKWRVIVALEDIARAKTLGREKCDKVATYLPDGRKILDVLSLMPEGMRKEAFERRHSFGMVNLCYIEGGKLELLK